MAQGHSVDEYLETIYFLAFPIGEYTPRGAGSPPLASGTRATIVRLAEHDGELLHWFYDQKLVPGTEITVERAEPAADQFVVRLDGTTRSVSEKAAAGLFVRPE